MKSMLTAFAAVAVIAIGADFVLDGMGYSAEAANSGSAVRLDSDRE
ncbi:hypothetical protein AAFO92_20215 [Roseovarius sp. CAU 1744]